jgi:toxin ParE1/3/4
VTVVFHPDAQDEFVETVEYYEATVPDLGDRFLRAVERTVAIVQAYPESGGRRAAGSRGLPVFEFPYDLVYRIRGSEIEVLALAHHRRRPGYWRQRASG